MNNYYPLVWMIIGMSGSGKTSVGRLFAQQLNCDYLEGDRRHSQQNIIKMSSDRPLEAEDRLPWLLEIEADIRGAIAKNREVVITCSALKASYRQQLTSLGRVQLILLDVDRSLLEQRLEQRSNHYMKREMLPSQIVAFESISSTENVIIIDGNHPIDAVVSKLMTEITNRFPSMKKSWWDRGRYRISVKTCKIAL
jgi:gluconokinase